MFTLQHQDNKARTGIFHTSHGDLQTPFFMPVCTKAVSKDLSPEELNACNIQSIIANGFLMSLKPTSQVIAKHNGLHTLMQWHKGIFTDSGGFQILLSSFLIKKTPDGVIFRNPYTGQNKLFSPEESITQQHLIGSDVAMAFDDVVNYGTPRVEVEKALERSHAWLKRCITFHKNNKNKTNPHQYLFGIAQGETHLDLRKDSATRLLKEDVDGFAVGGLAIGEPPQKMFEAMKVQLEIFEQQPNKLRYIMGLGSPLDMLDAVALGADCFDSIFPTQNARRGSLFTHNGILRIENTQFKEDTTPIENNCQCYTCKQFTRAYVHHLLKTKERFGYTLACIHNIYFLQNMLNQARQAIQEKRFEEFRTEFKEKFLQE